LTKPVLNFSSIRTDLLFIKIFKQEREREREREREVIARPPPTKEMVAMWLPLSINGHMTTTIL